MFDRLSEVRDELNAELKENLELHERVRELENELISLRLKDRMSGMDALTVADRSRLLECAGNGEK